MKFKKHGSVLPWNIPLINYILMKGNLFQDLIKILWAYNINIQWFPAGHIGQEVARLLIKKLLSRLISPSAEK